MYKNALEDHPRCNLYDQIVEGNLSVLAGTLTEGQVANFMNQLLVVITTMQPWCMHRDIKLEHIICNPITQEGYLDVQLTDFHFATMRVTASI